MSYKLWCVFECVCVFSHMHVCRGFAGTQRSAACDPGLWKYIFTE